MKKNKPSYLIPRIWLGLLLAFPFVLWMLPADFFDQGPSLCPSRVFLDIECLGCGITRAVMHFHHLDFEEAIYYHSGVFILYPVLVGIWGYWAYNAWKAIKRPAQAAA